MAADTDATYKVVHLPAAVYRVARKGLATRYASITPEDDASPKAGGRFDVLGGGVLYAATEARTCFYETLAPLRPSVGITLEPADDDSAFIAPGGIPAQWREDRLLYELGANADAALPFVDLADVETRTWLYGELASELEPLGISHLDVPEVTHPNRVVSRLLSRLLYSITDEDEHPIFGGIRYSSRYNQAECWAIFDRCAVEVLDQHRIDRQDAVLKEVAQSFTLNIH